MTESKNKNNEIEGVATENTNKPQKDKAKNNKPTESKPTKKQAFMYLGPNIPGGVLFNGNLFKCNSIDDIEHLKVLFEKLPIVKELLVEVKQVPEFKRKILEQGTKESLLLQQSQMQLEDAIKEGVFRNV